MSEALLQSKAIVFFATHFVELSRGMVNCIGIANRHLQTETSRAPASMLSAPDDIPVVKMLYRVTEGAETETSYGISLAKAIGFPPSYIRRAETVAAKLRERALTDKNDKQDLEEAKRRKLVVNLDRQLDLACQSNAEDGELWLYLKKIHDDFWSKMLSSCDEAKITESFDEADDDETLEANEAETTDVIGAFPTTKSLKRKTKEVGDGADRGDYEVKRHHNRSAVDSEDGYPANESVGEHSLRNRDRDEDGANSVGSDDGIEECYDDAEY